MTQAKARAWVRLPSGRRLDLINPDPGAWLDSDLALRLARTYRWGGESSWPLPLSVAQHSLLVLTLRRQWSDTLCRPLTRSWSFYTTPRKVSLGSTAFLR